MKTVAQPRRGLSNETDFPKFSRSFRGQVLDRDDFWAFSQLLAPVPPASWDGSCARDGGGLARRTARDDHAAGGDDDAARTDAVGELCARVHAAGRAATGSAAAQEERGQGVGTGIASAGPGEAQPAPRSRAGTQERRSAEGCLWRAEGAWLEEAAL